MFGRVVSGLSAGVGGAAMMGTKPMNTETTTIKGSKSTISRTRNY